jgi:hypothetical protein
LTTISFFGVPVGQITTFPVPLPKEALARLKDGRLPIELGLRGNVRPEVSDGAKVRIRRAVVESPDDPTRPVKPD